MSLIGVIFSVAISVLILLVLIIVLKLNTFVSLIITSVIAGLFLNIPIENIMGSIENGIGSTLGHIALIFGLGAMLGKLLSDGGGASRIAETLISKFGEKYTQWAIIIASFIIGIALFLEVGLVLLIPLVFTIAKKLKVSQLNIGIPMMAALSVTHGYLPPHPGPTVIAKELHANIGEVLMYGIIIAIPVAIISGPLFLKVAEKIAPSAFGKKGDISELGNQKQFSESEMPSFGLSVFTALLPVILMLLSTVLQLITGHEDGKGINYIENFIYFIGTAGTAMMISVIFAVFSMGLRRGKRIGETMDSVTNAIYPIGMMLLIIGGGGAFKQILIDGGVGDTIKESFTDTSMSPLLFAWIIAAVLRIALGSATVAGISTTAIILPIVQNSDTNVALTVLAIGAGSLIFSHVNDAAFWMFKEYFGLTIKETFLTWSLLETVLSVSGIIFILFISLFV